MEQPAAVTAKYTAEALFDRIPSFQIEFLDSGVEAYAFAFAAESWPPLACICPAVAATATKSEVPAYGKGGA